ncbi:MAG: M20/M25/M40 family metallo-hydrolase [Acidobacteriota bacterium]
MLNVIQLTRQLVDIPSVTGEEREVGDFLFDLLQSEGWECRRQQVEEDRFNILATRGPSNVLLTTHMDTVPPFFESEEDEDYVYGRGACDAKGVAAAMICAARELADQDQKTPALLFVVGEETDSAGARKARDLGLQFSYIIDGEPTDNELVTAHKGIILARVLCTGITAHSSHPERGESAIDKLIEALAKLKRTEFPSDSRLGKTFLNIGIIEGGWASNVIADQAEAVILVRTVTDSRKYVDLLNDTIGNLGHVDIIKTTEPQEMESVDGFPSKVVAYGTDIPALRTLGRPLLIGPGSVFEAHTAREKIAKRELLEAVEIYKRLVRHLAESSKFQVLSS